MLRKNFPCIFYPLDSYTESTMLSAKEGWVVITGIPLISWSMSSIYLKLGLSPANPASESEPAAATMVSDAQPI
jgi:hypothetical protein